MDKEQDGHLRRAAARDARTGDVHSRDRSRLHTTASRGTPTVSNRSEEVNGFLALTNLLDAGLLEQRLHVLLEVRLDAAPGELVHPLLELGQVAHVVAAQNKA